MQTKITNSMAYGFDGEHANGQPFRADTYVASSEVTFGQPAFADGADGFNSAKATGTTYLGMFVGAHQHVRMVLPSDSRSLSVAAGTDVAVAARGSWFTSTTEEWAVGDALYIASYKYSKTDTDTTEVVVGHVVAVEAPEAGETLYRATVRLGE